MYVCNPPVNSMPYLGPEFCSHKSPKRVQMSRTPSTKFKSRYTHTELSLYKIQIHVKTKPYKTKGQTKKTLHKIQAPSSYKNSFLKTT